MTINKETSLGYRFNILSRLNMLFLNNHLKKFGISSGQVSCLAELLTNTSPVTQNAISAALAIDQAATTRTIDILIRKGFATRTVNPDNRRQNLVSATPAARRIAEEYFQVLRDNDAIFCSRLTAHEHKQLLKLMDRMIATAMKEKHELYN